VTVAHGAATTIVPAAPGSSGAVVVAGLSVLDPGPDSRTRPKARP